MASTAIDGDLAKFLETSNEGSVEYSFPELERYLEHEGHAPEVIYAAMKKWRGAWPEIDAENFQLTETGAQVVQSLRSQVYRRLTILLLGSGFLTVDAR